MVFLILFLSFSLKNDAFLIGFKSFLILFSYSFYLFYSFLMHYGCIFSQTLWLFLLLMLFIKQLPVVYCFLVYHVPYILMLFLNHCHFFPTTICIVALQWTDRFTRVDGSFYSSAQACSLECNDTDAGRKICECLFYILSISTDNIL